MQIKIENFEAKNIINFYLPQNVAPEGTLAVATSVQNSKTLLGRILQIDGVVRCLLSPMVISVQYSASATADTKLLIMAEIEDFYSEQKENTIVEQTPIDELQQAEALADAFIRPSLYRDKGDIVLHSVKNGVIELSFTGHCAGCPYAQNTLHNVVFKTFKQYMPQIYDVHLKEA
ncbi:MAG: NifU family protein [Alphaproteobacteria bacterium]|nr:NifU family protein [Alphaproteobacteria bacterium]